MRKRWRLFSSHLISKKPQSKACGLAATAAPVPESSVTWRGAGSPSPLTRHERTSLCCDFSDSKQSPSEKQELPARRVLVWVPCLPAASHREAKRVHPVWVLQLHMEPGKRENPRTLDSSPPHSPPPSPSQSEGS